jgi:hypothetical protein
MAATILGISEKALKDSCFQCHELNRKSVPCVHVSSHGKGVGVLGVPHGSLGTVCPFMVDWEDLYNLAMNPSAKAVPLNDLATKVLRSVREFATSADKGKDLLSVTKSASGGIRNVYITKSGGNITVLRELGPKEFKEYSAWALGAGVAGTAKMSDLDAMIYCLTLVPSKIKDEGLRRILADAFNPLGIAMIAGGFLAIIFTRGVKWAATAVRILLGLTTAAGVTLRLAQYGTEIDTWAHDLAYQKSPADIERAAGHLARFFEMLAVDAGMIAVTNFVMKLKLGRAPTKTTLEQGEQAAGQAKSNPWTQLMARLTGTAAFSDFPQMKQAWTVEQLILFLEKNGFYEAAPAKLDANGKTLSSAIYYRERPDLVEKGMIEVVRIDPSGHPPSAFKDGPIHWPSGERIGYGDMPHFHKELCPLKEVRWFPHAGPGKNLKLEGILQVTDWNTVIPQDQPIGLKVASAHILLKTARK